MDNWRKRKKEEEEEGNPHNMLPHDNTPKSSTNFRPFVLINTINCLSVHNTIAFTFYTPSEEGSNIMDEF